MISAALTLGGRRVWRIARAARPLFLFFAGGLVGALTLMIVDAWLRPSSVDSICWLDILSAKRGIPSPQLSTPRSNSGLLLIGVMTAARYVDTRARAVWQTWAHATPGRTLFFVAANTTIRPDHSNGYGPLPVVRLPGVDDVYPPQKKSFAMLRWMYDNYDFEWFMRVDDDLYVRNERLTAFLRQLDAGRTHMLGQAGLGNSAEYGQLALGARDNYCMGGPGVILSREALRQLGPHLETCLRELATSHEDVEVGRCVRRYVGITCTWNYEMQTLFHNNQTGGRSADAPVTGELRRVLTLHPVKNADLMLKVHMRAEALRLAELRARHVALTRERDAAATVNGATATLKLMRRAAKNPNDLTCWDYMSLNKLLFCANRVNCPRHTINSNQRAAVNEVVTQLFDKFNANARQRGRLLQFQNVQYGYVRVEPRYGVDYVFDIVLWFKKLRPARTISVRRHAYVQQTFSALEVLTDAEYRALHAPIAHTNTLPIYIIIALRGRGETFQRFARRLRDILRPDERDVKIVIVLYRSDNDSENVLIAETIGDLSQSLHVRVIDITAPPTAFDDVTFSRGRALKIGASTAPSDALLFFADVDMLFDYDTLQRIRLNVIEGVQVYFPIIFSQYMKKYWRSYSFTDSKSTNESHDMEGYASDRGYFRSFGFGIVAIHARDFARVGGFNVTIRGWGIEDVDFFERCIRARLRILRAPDPSLIHVAHPIECRSDTMSSAQYQMCVGTKAASMASRDFLADHLAPHFGGVIP